MRINLNNDISVYRGETAAIDFKFSQRSDYYVPFLISSARVNPMVCITIGSARRETKNITTVQLWLDLTDLEIPRFTQTVVEDLGTLSAESEAALDTMISEGIMYQYLRASEVAEGNSILHFAYIANDVVLVDDYHFVITMALDDTITLNMENIDYQYQIELMDTEPMITHIISVFNANPSLLAKLPNAFTNDETGVTTYLAECIALITKTFPKHWGYRINDPLTSPVASVSNIQMLQPPRKLTVQAVVR